MSRPFPPSPYDILHSRDLDTPVLDGVAFCVPSGIDEALDPILEQAATFEWQNAREMLADWAIGLEHKESELVVLDSVFHARAAETRDELLLAAERFRDLLRSPEMAKNQICPRMELARIFLMLSRESEAAAQLTKAEEHVDEMEEPGPRRAEILFWRAEIMYRTRRPFDAHLAYRKLAKGENARLALASRLRLTDLSFDAGKVEKVTAEYEVLLPRASAFGASTQGWALRASEAALDAGDPERGLRWLESFLENKPGRDARDTAEIRLADIDAAFDDVLRARKRLSKVSGRRRGDPIGMLASIRAIALGVTDKSPEQRLDVLLVALRDQRRGVRRYALGVLMGELSYRGDLDGALAVATRLAYEGIDPVITPNYGRDLDALLERVVVESREGGGCQGLVSALGGRYGILIERATKPNAFARVGVCFEEMELPWIAATVYRTIARRFGAFGAQSIALPLARSSLAIGEVTLAKRVAMAALEDETSDTEAWKAIIAEVDFIDGRIDEAVSGILAILDSPKLRLERGKLVRLLALSLNDGNRIEVARYIGDHVPDWLVEGDAKPAAHASMIESVILAAHSFRQAGHPDEALPLYKVVDLHAGPSALRSSARFWLGALEGTSNGGREFWGENPNETLGSPWGRLALFEDAFIPLRAAYSEAIR